MQKAIAIFLSVLLLSSATGIAYGQHFCGGDLMKSMFTFSEAALDCGMEMKKTPPICELETNTKTSMHANDCCDNQLHQVETDEHFSGSQAEFNFHKNFVFAFASVFMLNSFKETTSRTETSYYFPPPIDKDVQVLYQVFLI